VIGKDRITTGATLRVALERIGLCDGAEREAQKQQCRSQVSFHHSVHGVAGFNPVLAV
jgi:hypothetical protein